MGYSLFLILNRSRQQGWMGVNLGHFDLGGLSAEETDFLIKCSLLLARDHIKEPNALQMCHLLTPMVNRLWKDTNIINVAISNS